MLGEAAAEEAAKQSSTRDSAARRADIQKKLQQSGPRLSNKKRQQLKKAERKLANEERKRCEKEGERGNEAERSQASVPPSLQSLSI